MTELQLLPPDQRAVLSLVLDRGKSYAEVASMLSIPEATVRERAHAALDALAAPGQPTVPPPPGPAPRAPSSRRGGAILLAALAVAVVVAVVLLATGGKGGGKSSSAASTTSTGSTSTSTSASRAKAQIDNKLTLTPAEPESNAGGEAYVLSDGSRHAFYIAARHLAPSHGFFYAVWLYNSPSSSAPLGRAPSVGSDGRLEGGGPLPSNASDYARLIVTRETNTRARHPGTVVLNGRFSLR